MAHCLLPREAMQTQDRFTVVPWTRSRGPCRTASWLWACCSIASLHAGCSGDADEADTAQAVTPDWIHPACAPDALQPPTTVADGCNGPWTFNFSETWTYRAACGEDTAKACETFNSCLSW